MTIRDGHDNDDVHQEETTQPLSSQIVVINYDNDTKIYKPSQQHHHRHAHHHHCPTDMGSKWSESRFGQGSYPYIVSTSVLTYWIVVSIIPIYNKYFFDKTLYPYPIATAGIQLGLVAVLLTMINVMQHYYAISECVMSSGGKSSLCRKIVCKNDTTSSPPSSSSSSPSPTTISWIFGPHLLWKLQYTIPIGTLFGLKYAVTNWGLHLVPAPTHLLLQSTDMVWTLLSAWIINKEHVTKIGLCCVLGCVLGSVALSIRIGQTVAAPMLGIGVNLLSPILLGLCITTLRLACTELMGGGNRVRGTVSSFELSALKLMISAPVALVLACFLENDHDDTSSTHTTPTWLTAFINLPLSTKLGVMGGSLFILVFQVNCTFLAFLTSAVDVGLCGQVKIIPQWIAAALFFNRDTFHVSRMNGIGAFLTLMSASVFVISDWLSYKYPNEYMGASFVEDDADVVVESDKVANDDGMGVESQALLSDGQKKEQYHNTCQSQQQQQQQVVVSINNYSSI